MVHFGVGHPFAVRGKARSLDVAGIAAGNYGAFAGVQIVAIELMV
jgi:hypothetical protein